MGEFGAGWGEGFAFLSATAFAAANVAIAKSAAQKRGDNGALLSVTVTALGAGLLWLASAPSSPESWASRQMTLGLAWFALSGLLTIVLGRSLLFRSVAALGPVRASAVKRLNPFFSVFLAILVLGEVINLRQAIGMGLIATSFLVLILPSFRGQTGGPPKPESQGTKLTAYAYGPASALCYAVGYIARKYGLFYLPDPSLGTFVGAAAGLFSTAAAGLFWPAQRRMLVAAIKNVTAWQFATAVLVSIGQLSGFNAIKYIEISRFAMISSLEVFISMLLSVFVLRMEAKPSPSTVAAAAAATAGALLVAIR